MSDDVSGAVQQGYKFFFTNPHMEGRFLYLLPQVAAKIAALQLIRQPFITIVTQKENTCV